MKFKNFDIEDVFGPDDIKEAEKHVGEIGYFEDSLDDLDNAITYFPKKTFKLIRIKQANSDNKYVINAACSFKYFLSLNNLNIKKTKPVETKEKKYRPIKSLFELALAFYGVPNYYQRICLGGDLFVKYKNDKNYKRVLITSLEFDKNHALSTINGITLRAWFDHYELRNDKGEWVPFGVEVEEDE